MHVTRRILRPLLGAAMLLIASGGTGRSDDDVVAEESPQPPAEAPGGLRGVQVQGGRVIVGRGWRVQGVRGRVQLQVQGDAPPAEGGAVAGAEGRAQAFLGAAVGPVSEPVRAQLDLPDGVGLSIDAVAAGGPAERAGVRRFDVLRVFNDQVVRSVEQLNTLVRVAGAGTTVPLTLIRGGREQVVEVVIAERVVPAGAGADGIVGAMPGAVKVRVVSDVRGTVEIRAAAGTKKVTVKKPDGEEVHSGPLDTEEDLEKVPEEYRDWVREVDGGQPAVRGIDPDAKGPGGAADEQAAPAARVPSK